MVDIQKEFASNQAILLLMDSLEYNSIMINNLKSLKDSSICYVTTNKSFGAIKEIFKKEKLSMKNILFIDAISKTFKKVMDTSDNVYYVSSPGALTELSLVAKKFLKHNFDYLVFDSLTNLTVYNKVPACVKFLTDLTNSANKTKTKVLMYAFGSKKEELILQSNMFVDKIVETKSHNEIKSFIKESPEKKALIKSLKK